MPTEPQMKPIAETLLQRTRKNEVNWVEEEDNDTGTAYSIKLPQAGIVLKLVTPIAEPDAYVLALLDEKGHAAVAWNVEEPTQENDLNLADWNLLSSLFREARRVATGWDKVLKAVETALSGQGPIGIAPSRK